MLNFRKFLNQVFIFCLQINYIRKDVQKYICPRLILLRVFKLILTIRDRINDVRFRQRLDPINKNIFRRHNPLELVFEDISTFDAENPIVGSLLREIDIKKTVRQRFY